MALGDGISFQAASAGAGTFVFANPRASFLTLAQAVTLSELTDGQTVSYLAVDSLTNPTQRAWGHGTFHVGSGAITRDAAEKWVNNVTAGTTPLAFAVPPFVSLTVLAPDIIQTIVDDNNVTGVLSPGTLTLDLVNLPNDIPMAGDLLATNIAAPSTPAAGKTRIYVDSAQKVLSAINQGGVVSITVIPAIAPTNQFLTGLGAAGNLTSAQPAFTNIFGTLGSSQFGPLTGDVTTSGYAATIAANAVSNSKLAQAAAWTLKGNATGSLANVTDFTIDSLTLKAAPTTADEVAIWDAAASAMKKASIAGLVGAGVSSFNTRTGAVTSAANDYTQAQITPAYAMTSFTSSGTFTTPANSTTATVYRFRMVGGGGGGGGGSGNAGLTYCGNGGSGAEYREGTFSGILPNTGITITVGGGGGGGNTGIGSSGGNSGIGAVATAVGGTGGAPAGNSSNIASCGTGSGGSVAVPGGNGGGGLAASLTSGNYLSPGGNSIFGFCGLIEKDYNGGNGANGVGYGAGGGGSLAGSFAGGNGSGGIVIIERIQG